MSPAFIRRLSSWLVISTAITLAAGYGAQLYQWDSDTNAANNNVPNTGSGLGGAGTWNTAAAQWWNGAGPDVAWNNATFDTAEFGGLDGGTVTVGTPVVAGELRFKTGGYVITPSASNTLRLEVAGGGGAVPIITANASATIGVEGVSGITGSQGVTKRGGGTLTVLGNNTGFSGTITLQSGTLELSGGLDTDLTSTKSLGDAQPITLEGGVLRFLNNSGTALYNNDITMKGNATINVDRVSGGSSNVIELGDLTMGAHTLTTTNGNTYGVRFMGLTTLTSEISTFNATFNPAAGVLAGAGATSLGGQVTGPGALNKIGAGTLFLFNAAFGPDNDYAGGTNVFAGTLSLADGFTQLGSGNVIVYPGATLRFEDNLNFLSLEAAGATLSLQSSSSALSVLAMEADFTPDTPALASALIGRYGATVQIRTTSTDYSGVFDFSKIGTGAGGHVFLGASQNTQLIGFDDQIIAGADGVYRLGANNAAATTLTLAIPNLINGGAGKSLEVGVPIQNVQNITNSTGTVSVIESQNYGGLTTINTGSTLSTGGSGPFDPPRLGTGSTINIYGTLTLAGGNHTRLNQTIFNVLQARGTNGAMTLTVTDPDFFNVGSTDARIAPGSILNFNGGTLTFNGYASGNTTGDTVFSNQTVAQFNASAANIISLSTGTTLTQDLDTVLTINNLNRILNGTVSFSRTGAVSFGNTSTRNDIRVIIGNAPVVTSGMIAPWLIDVSAFTLPTASATTQSGSSNVTVSTVDGLVPGMIVTGTGIPLGAAVTSVSPNVVMTGGATVLNSPNVSVVSTAGLVAGMLVTGSNIPAGTRVQSVTDATNFVMNANATNGGVGLTINSSALFTISNPATGSNSGQTFTATGNQFMTYGASGVSPAPFDVYATNAATLQGAAATAKVAITSSFATTAGASVYALRIGDVDLTGTNTITIGAGASATDGAGLIMSQTIPVPTPAGVTGRTHTPNFVFGTGGNREAVIYVTGPGTATLSGSVTANGLTKFGNATLRLVGANPNLTGTITINQGSIDGNPVGFNYLPVVLNAGTLNFDTGGSANVGSSVTVNGDSTITAGDVEVPRIASLTINARPSSSDPIVFNISQGLSVTGNTVLNGNVNWNNTRADRNSDVRARVLLAGKVTGAGSFTKWAGGITTAGMTAFLNGANDYLGSTTVNGGSLESLTAVGTPFGTGSITVNPGGLLRIVDPANLSGNALTVTSDNFGLGVLALAYGGKVALNGGLTGTMNFDHSNFGGPFSTVLAIDAVGYSGNINLNTLAGGRAFLGTALGGNFSGTITASTLNNLVPDLNGGAPVVNPNGVYRLGGGGSGFLNFVVPNQLAGNSVVQIGAISNVTQGASVMLHNGNQNTNNQGAVQLLSANNYSGLTILNGGTTTTGLLQPAALSVGHKDALGTSKIIFNGGAIQAPTNIGLPFLTPVMSIDNAIGFTGDAVFNGSTNLILTGPVSLADNQVGVTRTITVNNTVGLTTLGGIISDGAGTAAMSSLTKAGAGPLAFTGANTYTGFTNINAGTIVLSRDTDIQLGSQITFGGTGGAGVTGAIGVWNNSFTTNRNYIIQNGANGTFDVGAAKTLTQSTLSNISGIGADTALLKTGHGTLVLNGHNSFSATGSWAIRILNGVVEVNSDVNLGDPVANKGIVVQGGTLRVTDNLTSARQIINGAATGSVDVVAGKTFISTGLLNSNAGTNVLTKTGAGTLQNDFNNANLDRFTIQSGVYSSSSFSAMADFVTFTANTASNTTLGGFSPGSLNKLYVGQAITGTGIAANARITDIDYLNGTATMSVAATATGTGVSLATGATGILALNGGTFELVDRPVTSVTGTSTLAPNNSLVTVPSTAGLRIGQTVTGPNINPGTTIAAIENSTTFLLSVTPVLANPTPTTFTLGAAGNTTGIGTVAYGGGGRLKVESSPGLSTQLSVGNFTRFMSGTLVVDPGASNLAVAGNANNVRVIPVTSINGIAVASANVNGILAPNIITQVGGVGNFATYTNSTTGIASYTGATVASLNGLQPAAIGNITAPQALTGTNSIYAFRTTSDILGGTLVLPSVTANREGGILVNNSATISTNLVFDPTSTTTIGLTAGATTINTPNVTVASTAGLLPGMPIFGSNIPAGTFIAAVTSATTLVLSTNATATGAGQTFTAHQGGQFSGEGLFYTAPGVTATLSGNVMAGSFTKFGAGTVVFGGSNNGILGTLAIQDGTLKVAPGARFSRLQTDLVLNGSAVFDLAGNNERFSSIGNSNPLAGGLITNTGTSDATFSIVATAPTQSGPLTRPGTVGQNNQVISGLFSTADLSIGMPVFGTNVAAGAVIRSIDSATQISLSAPGNNANVAASIQSITFGSLYSGLMTDGPTNKLAIEKSGAGIITLGAYNVAFPDAGDNSYTGGTTVNQGTLLVENPLALGGANGTIPGAVNLYGGTLDLRSNGGGVQGTIILGNQSTNGANVNIYGPATINVDRLNSTTISGNKWQINNLVLSENTLTMTGANTYGLRVAGTTTIAGSYANINSASDQASGNIEFAGPIVGSGAFNKYGTAIQRVATIAGSANTYSGGTNVVSGGLQVTATTGTPLGTGRVNVFPGGMLRIAGLDAAWKPGAFSSVAGQAELKVHGYFNSLGVVALDNSFNPSALLTAANFSNAYGTTGLGLSTPFFTQTLDLSAIGDGRAFLISGLNTEVAYLAPNLIPGVGNGTAPRTYRLAGGVNNLALIGADNVLNDLAAAGTSLQVGSPNSIFSTGGAITNTGNAVIIRNSNSYTGGTWIGKGSIVTLGVGASPVGSTPLGSANGLLNGAASDVVIYGTLQLESRLESSFFNAATGRNANNYLLRPGGAITLVDFAGETSGGNDRWADTDANGGGLNLNGGSFRYNGAAHIESTERVGTFTVDKGSRILVDQANNSGTATLIVNDLVRANRGTLVVQPLIAGATTGNSLGFAAETTIQLQQVTGYSRLVVNNGGSAAIVRGGTTALGAGAINTGMAPGWIIDASANSFVTYNPTAENSGYQALVTTGSPGASAVAGDGTFTPGVNQVGYSKIITATGAISGSISLTSSDIVDINTTGTVTLNSPSTSVYALRTNRDVNPTAANNTLTIGSGALIGVTNTLTFNNAPAAANAAPLWMTLNFGVGGSAEALIFSSSQITINAQINAAGLTRFTPAGSGQNLILTGNNNFTGDIRINQGIIQGNNTLSGIGVPVGGVFNNRDIYLQGALNRDASRLIIRSGVGNAQGSVLASNVEATSQIGGTIFVNGDSRIDTNGATVFQRINNLTFADLGPNNPVGLALGNIYVAGTTTLGANDNQIEGFFNSLSSSVFGGLVQGGTLSKFGNGTMLMAGTANTYAATIINEGTINTATSIFGSLTRTGNPFGTGPITINPGAMLRLADASNIASNVVTMKSGGVALGGLAIAYNSTAPISGLFGAGPGKVNMSTTGDYVGVIALDINNYINPISMAALETAAGGKLWLGTSISATYFGQNLAPGLDNVYRLGGGGNQGNLTIGASSFANVLTGTASVVIGAQTAGLNVNGPAYINGNFGSVILTNRNNFSGGLTLNNQAGLAVNNSYALGSGPLSLAGGNLILNNTVFIPNEVRATSDSFSTSGGGNAAFTGAFKLAPADVGGTITMNMGGTGVVGFQGVISGVSGLGTPGSNVIKTGGQTVIFNAANTFQGTTSVINGFLGVGTDVLPDVAGALGINDVPVILGNAGTNTAGSLLLGGQITFDRGVIATGGNGTGINTLRGQSINRTTFTGGIAVTGAQLNIDQVSTSNGTFRGGVLDLQGAISGTGLVQIGNSSVQGSVRLSASANGFGTSTFSGGLTLQAGRLQVNADTYYTGPATNPTIISGPLGTGTFTFGAGNTNAGGEIVAYGADRVIVNPLGNLSTAADTTITFGGHNNLTFTRNLDINSDATLRNRTFNVLASQGVTEFSGNLTASGAAGGRLTKAGVGTLVLSGANTFSGAAGTSLITISAGVVRFSSDANLGAISVTQSNLTMGANTTLVLVGTTPVTWSAATSNRNLNRTAAGSVIDVRDAGGLLTINTQVTGAFNLTKQGSGTLALNNGTNALTALIIGGPPAAAAANLPSGTFGGVVSTTATSGAPFSGTVTINDGTLSLVGGSVAQALTIGSVTFAAGSSIQLNRGSTTSALTATALTRANQGTLIIVPSVLANLGASEQLITSSPFANSSGMLTSPTVIVRDLSNQNLNFVQYGGAPGFVLHTATTMASFTTSNATQLANITGGAQAVSSPTFDVLALRTDSNVTGTGNQLRLTNGGLIFNGTTAPTVSANVFFGNGTTATEALVYVRGGQSGPSVLSGSFTATNFTKSGLGDLLISGLNNVMAPSNTALQTLQINDGTVKFAGQSSLPSNGLITISPMDGATLDLNGQNLTIAALGGQTAGTAATGRVINSGAFATLTLASETGITSNSNGFISGNLALVKSGVGTVTFGYNNDYSGGTTIDVGSITSAAGILTPVGTLQVNSFSSLGTGTVNLAGGVLDIRNPVAANEVQDNIDVISFGPENGYDFVVKGVNIFGTANTTSTINTTSTVAFQAINGLTFQSNAAGRYALTTGGASDSGLLVRGTTTLAGDTTFNINRNAVLAGKVAGTGSTITKIGNNTLFLTNTERAAAANDVGRWNLFAGSVEVRMSQGGSNPLTNGATVQMSTTGQLNIRHDGDNLTDPQVLSDFATNTLQIGNLLSVSTNPTGANSYTASPNTILNLGSNSAALNKTVQFNQLVAGGPLGASFLTLNLAAANGYTVEFVNGLTMVKDAYLTLNNNGASLGNVTFNGQLSGNGTLFKDGGGELDINTVATNTGGTVLAAGDTFFGSFQGQTRTLSTTAKLAPGNISIQPGARLRFNAITNLNGSQLVEVRSNISNLGLVGIGDNTSIHAYNIRAPFAAGAFSASTVSAPLTGSGVLALNTLYDASVIDLRRIGDGTWFLGSTGDGSGLNLASSLDGRYNAAQLLPGVALAGIGNSNPTYRLGGGAGTLYIGLAVPGSPGNQLFGNANLVVGADLTNGFAGTVGNGATAQSTTGSAGIILNQTQSYTGNTVVNRGSQLEFRGGMSTVGYDVFGILTAGGSAGTFAGGPTPVIRQGGQVNLDNQFDLLPVASVQGRWGDATAINLNSGTVRVIGNSAADLREVVGQVNVAGGSFLTPQRAFGGRIMEINVAGITRLTNQNGITGNNGQLSIEGTTAAQLGSDERVTVAGANLAAQIASIPGGITNGMVAPWMYNNRDMQFVTYSDFGFVNAGFTRVASGALTAGSSSATDRTLINGTATMAAGVDLATWALRSDASITGTDATSRIIIGSGGLISNAASTITSNLVFGSIATPGEAIIANAANLIIGTTGTPTTLGQITATGIVKSGVGSMFMDAEQGTFTGNIAVNGGGLFLRTAQAASNAGGIGGTIVINGFNSTVGFRSDIASTFNNDVLIAPGNALTVINVDRVSTGTGLLMSLSGNLTLGGAPGEQGQTINFTSGNTYAFRVNGTTNLGPAGNAVFYNNASAVTLAGAVTGSGTFVKEGSNTLFLGSSGFVATAANTHAGGTILQQGTLQATSGQQTDSDQNIVNSRFGTGDLTLMGGTLNLRVQGANNATNRVYTFNGTPNVNVTGNVTINVDRVTSGGGTAKTVAFNNLNIGGQILTASSANSYSLRFNNTLLSGTPTFQVNNDLILSNVSDGGGDLFIVKNGTGNLWMDGTGSTYSGGTFVNSGILRFGNTATPSTTAQAGTGTIQINPGAQIRVEALGNINTGAGQQVLVQGVNPSLAVLRVLAAVTPANISTLLDSDSSAGALRIEAAYASALDLGAIGDGTFYLGSVGSLTYSGAALGVGAGNTYRLGANNTAGDILTLAPSVPANLLLTGASKVVIGSLANNGQGIVLLNNNNNYTGGTTISRGSEARIASGTASNPLGSDQVDVFGILRAENASGSFRLTAGSANSNTIVLHPGGTLRFENNITVGNNNRWDDATAIALNGSTVVMNGLSNNISAETVGAVSFSRGSRATITSNGTGQSVLTVAVGQPLTRVGTGTLVFTNGATGRLGNAPANNSERFVVTGGAASVSGAIINGMLPAYYIAGTDNTFVTYGANGFTRVAFNNTNFAPGFTNASIVDVTANTTLSGDSSIYALRVGNAQINSAFGRVNTLTLNGAGTAGSGGGIIFSAATGVINTNLSFNGFEGLIYAASPGIINGDISGVSSAGITKFGASTLTIGKDQNDAARGVGAGYSSGWTVNEGTLIPSTFGALGNATAGNTVTLNGSVAGAAALTLSLNQGNPLNEYYTMGNLQVTDNAVINYLTTLTTNTVPDRTQSLGQAGALSNVVVTSTGGAAQDAQFTFTTNQQRAILQVGDVSVSGANAGVILNIAQTATNNNLTSGVSSGLSVASLSGTADQTIRKWGNAELYIRGASAFAGTVSIEQGPVAVFNSASLGTGALVVKLYGTVDVQVANYTPANSSVTYEAGSIERWSVDGARTGSVNLGGATLQVANDQTANVVAVTLNGGSIEGFQRVDDVLGATQAVYRTLGAGVTFNLAGDSFLGQNLTQGLNGYDNGRQANTSAPLTSSAAGVLLDIKGVISGVGGLTKQGNDVVTLSGANTYAGSTNVLNGTVRIGATNSLPVTTDLITGSDAVFNLNGFNQQIGRLSSPAITSGVAGYVTNTATTTNVLTMGAATNASYGGVIQYNVAVTKGGVNVQTLTNNNTYIGDTVINGGALEVSGSLSGTTKVDVNTGGTLTGIGSAAGPVNLNGGVFSPGVAGLAAATAGVNSVGTFNAAGGFNTTGGGTLKLDLQSPFAASNINDKVNVTGAISLTGTTTIALTLTGGYTPANGDLFFIALNDGLDLVTGSPGNFFVANTGGFDWQVFTSANVATGLTSGGNDIAILAIPEPNSLSLLAGSLSLAVGLQRFRRRRR